MGRLRDSRRGNDCDGWRALSQLCDQVHFECGFVDVVTVADVDDENLVGNSLLQIWKLGFGHKAKLLFRLSPQSLDRSLKLKFRRDFEAEVWLRS